VRARFLDAENAHASIVAPRNISRFAEQSVIIMSRRSFAEIIKCRAWARKGSARDAICRSKRTHPAH
jgi:hypothetical protein